MSPLALEQINCTANCLSRPAENQSLFELCVIGANHAIAQLKHKLKTLWLFTWSDLRTMLVPMAALGILSAIVGSPLTTTAASSATILMNTPRLVFWLWLNILVLSISNQRDPAAVIEDKLNKPWRPISAGRLTSAEARQWLLVAVPLLTFLGFQWGVASETMACIAANFYYNDLGGADEHFGSRQVINGLAYPVYGIAAIKLVAGIGADAIMPGCYQWMSILGLIVGTTIQIQDLKDYEGDKARDRSTIPVVFGDKLTRLSVCGGVLFWSAVCTAYWGSSFYVSSLVFASATLLSARVLRVRDPVADRFSFMVWSWWVMGLFFLPLVSGVTSTVVAAS